MCTKYCGKTDFLLVISVCSTSTGSICVKTFVYFLVKCVKRIQVLLKSDRSSRCFLWILNAVVTSRSLLFWYKKYGRASEAKETVDINNMVSRPLLGSLSLLSNRNRVVFTRGNTTRASSWSVTMSGIISPFSHGRTAVLYGRWVLHVFVAYKIYFLNGVAFYVVCSAHDLLHYEYYRPCVQPSACDRNILYSWCVLKSSLSLFGFFFLSKVKTAGS